VPVAPPRYSSFLLPWTASRVHKSLNQRGEERMVMKKDEVATSYTVKSGEWGDQTINNPWNLETSPALTSQSMSSGFQPIGSMPRTRMPLLWSSRYHVLYPPPTSCQIAYYSLWKSRDTVLQCVCDDKEVCSTILYLNIDYACWFIVFHNTKSQVARFLESFQEQIAKRKTCWFK
jgi:hypothetical protein